jgi:di-N-acetylchitobiase
MCVGVAVLETSTTGRLWDQDGASPYFGTADDDGAKQQVRYDDPESLRLKFQMAAQLGLRGVGTYQIDALPAGRSKVQQAQKAAMWRAFQAFAEATAVA